MKYEVSVEDKTYEIVINQDHVILVNGKPVEIDFTAMGSNGLFSLLVDNESFEAMVERDDDHWSVLLRGHLYEVIIEDERSKRLKARARAFSDESGEFEVKAPMPGAVVAIPVEVGQEVAKGDNIIILESMKMENELKAPHAGIIQRVTVKPGDSVEQHHVMVVIGPLDGDEE